MRRAKARLTNGMVSELGYIPFYSNIGLQWALTVVVAAACAQPWGWNRLRGLARAAGPVARSPWLTGIAVFVVSFAVTAALAIQRGLPVPYVHDEYSYLLSADTFAHGRVTNPTPPAWTHFESMHILVRPTYMSKYPPAQGVAMALGKVMAGREIYGVWLSTAAAAAAMGWMLRAFVPPRWALGGGLMVAIHPQMLEWGQRYWGGVVAVLGGAMLAGGMVRLVRSAQRGQGMRARDAAAAAAGMLIVGNSRPFEGFVVTALLLGWMGIALWRAKRAAGWNGRGAGWAVAAAGIVLIPGAALMGYYNWRVTGSALRLPYVEHQAQYAVVPLFIFQKASPAPEYHHLQLQQFYVREQGYWYLRHNSWVKLREEAWKNIVRLWEGWLGNVSVLMIPLALVPWLACKHRTVRWITLVLGLLLLALLTETFMYPHYAAPAAGLAAAVNLIALRQLAGWGAIGRALGRVTVGVFVLWALFWWVAFFHWRQDPNEWQMRRQWIAREYLGSMPGKHLVLVRYGDHNVHQEWVYNGADLMGEKVIWAREARRRKGAGWDEAPDEAENRRLLEAFKDRTAWLVEADAERPTPVAYPVRLVD